MKKGQYTYFVFLDRPAWPSRVKCRVGAVRTDIIGSDWRDALPPSMSQGGRHVVAANMVKAIQKSGLRCP